MKLDTTRHTRAAYLLITTTTNYLPYPPTAPIPVMTEIPKEAIECDLLKQVSSIELSELETTLSHCPNTISLSSPADAARSEGKIIIHEIDVWGQRPSSRRAVAAGT